VARILSPLDVFHFVQAGHGSGAALAWIAGQQLSLVTAEQLHAAGVRRGAIAARVANESLHRRHRGVYLVGSPVPPPGSVELAALLACGRGALISHRSAAALWGLAAAPAGEVDVSVIGRHCRSRDGINVHFAGQLDQRDRRHHRGIPITAPARTLIEFGARATDDELERAISEARALRLLNDAELEAALQRAGRRDGTARVREFLRVEHGSGFTRSTAERRMRRLLGQSRLPQPVCNGRAEGYTVDFLWPNYKVIVEVDGYQFHSHRRAFERDRRKDQALVAAGYLVVRVTWLQLRDEPLMVAAAVAGALAASRARA